MRFHIALSASDIDAAVADYRMRLGTEPAVLVPGAYALFRTRELNVSLRCDPAVPSGQLRHLGWEDATAGAFTSERDALGIVWERFSIEGQAAEIEAAWPEANVAALRRGGG